MSWVFDNLGLIGELTLVHVRQSVIALVIGFVLSVPLGWVAWRYKIVRSGIITITGLLYTIPSIALLLLLPPVLGYPILSEANLIVALTIYALAILVRAVADGLDSVDPSVRQAAIAVGFGPFRRFWAVEFPLAGPVILAGLRVTAASTVSLATVGILVGIINLGYLFTNGLQRRIVPEVLTGVVVVMVLALVIDAALVIFGRVLMPWVRAHRSRSRSSAARTVAAEKTA
ncbi:osmoprotectant transport system permease protein [Microbacterium endophyticum]|uniref:Osmoprotectant transport system permease protein n=1 Tax=Microbacterium endophyticum TaxID=1526412 RepID=A0A7W4YLW2_9MICO|nr:ABC transporter permease subunit [Microbacterium endophyticum]MBB2974889.1 osmoprotectant transport system permease protein [Microbacterium endophyticum]NIK37186.1 osmoprotectant transport system permease protein [Microbacterium endophyticum]